MRCWLLLTGVVIPVAAIAYTLTGANAAIRPMWQSGQAWVYAGLLVSWPPISRLLPLICFSVVSLTTLVCRPSTFEVVIVRLGIYAGAILAAVCLGLVMLASGPVTIVAALGQGVLVAIWIFTIGEIAKNWRRFSISQLMLLTAAVGLLAALVGYLDWASNILKPLLLFLYLLLAAAPTLNFLAYLFASVHLFRRKYEDRSSTTTFWRLGGIACAIAWYWSWKAAIESMLREYQALPPQNPGCYVCSAASYGHARFVQVRKIGQMRVSPQMQRCKFLELALKATQPGVHAMIRQCYDVIGPRLARICASNVWFADTTYVLLKPVEMLAEAIRIVAGVRQQSVSRIYVCREQPDDSP